jgi:hypothetical protein
MVLECTDKTNEQEAITFLQSLGAHDVSVQMKETGWWLGRYDKAQQLYENRPEVVA